MDGSATRLDNTCKDTQQKQEQQDKATGRGRGRGSRRRSSEPSKPPPVCPPSPTLAHLTPDEIQVLNNVFYRQEQFEQEEANRIMRLQKELHLLEDRVRQASAIKSKLAHADLRLCRLCFKTKFADGIGRACYNCHRRVCNRCGTFSKAKWDAKKNKFVRGKWRCNLCHKRREVMCATGMWFHGESPQPPTNTVVFRRKISDVESDTCDISSHGHALDFDQSDSPYTYSTKTDSELSHYSLSQDSSKMPKRLPRRRLLSSEEFSDMLEDDEDDQEVDDKQFMLERQKSRKERLKMQRKLTKRRSRRSSVGTCTQEDGIITDYTTDPELAAELEAMGCPMHGSQPSMSTTSSNLLQPNSPKERRVSFEDEKSSGLLDVCVGPQQERRKSAPSRVVDTGPLPTRRSSDSLRSSMSTHTHGSSPGSPKVISPAASYTGSHGSSYCSSGRSPRRSPNRSPRNSLVPSPLGPPGPVARSEQRRRSKEALEIAHRQSMSDLSNIPVQRFLGNPPRDAIPVQMMTLHPPGMAGRQRSNSSPLSRVRRSSSDGGDSYLNSLVSSLRFVEDNVLDTHSSDSGVLLNPDPDHLLNPHLSAFRKNSLNDSPPLLMSSYNSMGNMYVPGQPEMHPRLQKQLWNMSKSESSEHSSTATGSMTGRTDSSGGAHEGKPMELFVSPLIHFHTPPTTDETSSSSSSKDSYHRKLSATSLRALALSQSIKEETDSGTDSVNTTKQTSDDMKRSDTLSTDIKSLTTLEITKRRNSTGNQVRVVLTKDPNDKSYRTNGLGMCVVGGKVGPDRKLGAIVSYVKKKGPADQCGISEGDQVLEWDGSSLEDATYEETRQIMDKSGDTVQLVVMHKKHMQDKNEEEPPQILSKPAVLVEEASIDLDDEPARQEAPSIIQQELETTKLISGGDSSVRGDGGGRGCEVRADSTYTIPEHKVCKNCWHSKVNMLESHTDLVQKSTTASTKRMLPKTPDEIKREPRRVTGRLELRLWHDRQAMSLSVHVIRASGLPGRELEEEELLEEQPPSAFVHVHILPRMLNLPNYKSTMVDSCHSPVWNKTFMYQDLSEQQLENKSAEVTVWDGSSNSRFLGEVLLDLDNAPLNNTSYWYDLEDHDENNGLLPMPTARKIQRISSLLGESSIRQAWRSLPLLPPTPAHDRMKELLSRKSPGSKHADLLHLQTDSIQCSLPALNGKGTLSPTTPERSVSLEEGQRRSKTPNFELEAGSFIESKEDKEKDKDDCLSSKFKRRVTGVVTKVSAKFTDRRSRSLGEVWRITHMPTHDHRGQSPRRYSSAKQSTDAASCDLNELVRRTSRRHSVTTLHNISKPNTSELAMAAAAAKGRRGSGALSLMLLTPPHQQRRKSSQPLIPPVSAVIDAASAAAAAAATAGEDEEEQNREPCSSSPLRQRRPAPDGDDITSMLGPGQVPPRPSLEKKIQGDIQLGFVITKGQLEIDVICVKGLSPSTPTQLPDTYIKTYLVSNCKKLQKKKTKIIKASLDPIFRHKLKYSACNVHGRFLQVIVKEKSSGFDKNPCLGEVVIKLDNLELSSHTLGWYKLFQESATDFGSVESLNF